MGTTPILRLPYPEDPDTPNVPRDIKALAQAIEGIETVGQEIIVIDPNEVDFGWNDFPRGSTSGDNGYSGPNQSTSWNTSRVLCSACRWKFTAPTAGLLHISTYIHLGYNNSGDTADRYQDFYMDVEVLSGTANATHPDYARNRIEAVGNIDVGIVDWTAKLVSNFILSKGAVVAPFIAWRGRVHREGTSWRPKWSGGRMQAFFIPGRAVEQNLPPYNKGGQNPNRSLLSITDPDPDTDTIPLDDEA